MPYVFVSENTQGSCFRFLEEGDDRRVELFLTEPIGKIVTGTLALQVFDDRNYKRITFADAKNVYMAAGKQILDYIGIAKAKTIWDSLTKGIDVISRNELCHFDFATDELRTGKKLMRLECLLSALGETCLMCYDFETYTGCAYRFSDVATVGKWGEALGISQVYLYNVDDKFDSMVSIDVFK